MTKKIETEIEMPIKLIRRIKQIAKIAGTSENKVMLVIMAMELAKLERAE